MLEFLEHAFRVPTMASILVHCSLALALAIICTPESEVQGWSPPSPPYYGYYSYRVPSAYYGSSYYSPSPPYRSYRSYRSPSPPYRSSSSYYDDDDECFSYYTSTGERRPSVGICSGAIAGIVIGSIAFCCCCCYCFACKGDCCDGNDRRKEYLRDNPDIRGFVNGECYPNVKECCNIDSDECCCNVTGCDSVKECCYNDSDARVDSKSFTAYRRGIASKLGLLVLSGLTLFAVGFIAAMTVPQYILYYYLYDDDDDNDDTMDLQLQHKETENKALVIFGGIAGGVTLLMLAHYGLHPATRDYELYLLILGGLLDATTDILYMMMEAFATPALFTASCAFISLPIVVVAISFWPLMANDYDSQKWRYILLPLEGVLLLVVMPFTAVGYAVPVIAVGIAGLSWDACTFVASSAAGIGQAIYAKMYTEVTEEIIVRRIKGLQKNVKKSLKFYHKGLFQALLAFTLAPMAIVAVCFAGVVATIIVVSIALQVTAIAICLAFVLSLTAPLGIALVFSTMAFLRLFFLFPSVWEELYHLAYVFAEVAREFIPVDDFLDDDRLVEAKGQVFKLYETESAEGVKSDMRDSTIKYLFVEFLLEALPQLIIQGINNKQTDNWSNISIVSMVISGIIILNSVIKYGSLYLLAPEEDMGFSI